MTMHRKFALAVFATLIVGAAGASVASEPQRHVIGGNEIQARIEQQIGQADADRQAIQKMLQRADVRRIAGTYGLDLARASAAAAVLAGPSLEQLAAQARTVDANLAGGADTIIISATTVIIILLIIILIAH